MPKSPNSKPVSQLSRSLDLKDAVLIGLGSMIGAGIFGVFQPAAQAAGSFLILSLFLAFAIAYFNASSTAQLAAQYPKAGGSYLYGRMRLGNWPGFLAGWGFLIGKIASCAAMALVIGAYIAPGQEKIMAIGALITLGAINYFGITRTAKATKIIVSLTLIVLLLVVVAGWSSKPSLENFQYDLPNGIYGILQGAAILFFAFAGYARIATLGEEVKTPRKNIPKAILLSLVITLMIYLIIATTVLGVLGPELKNSSAPLLQVVQGANWPYAPVLIKIGATAAAAGALLALLAGISRTALAMAREADLPKFFNHTNQYQVPDRAEIAICLIICLAIALFDLREAVSFSSFGVLLYYLIANLAAYTQDAANRRFPKIFQIMGATLCLILMFSLPLGAIINGLVILAAGICYRAVSISLKHNIN